ncbi:MULTISPECIES: hypothetical protein [unclassified Pyramidobacter]|uniref:hypothetical protein n=1 Tax=unclassified Pyramidobacter TaxID=2632171 RepID=UPI000EA3DA44|nr:hypothetical protein [Pyramidobacter sp. CG50-2]RKJ79363.1 hypothetical protein D7D26_05055 [Pyramidobacter sp. CG50-2]
MKNFFRLAAAALCLAQSLCAAAAVPPTPRPPENAQAGEKNALDWYAPERPQKNPPAAHPFTERERAGWRESDQTDRQRSQEARRIVESAAEGNFRAEALCVVKVPGQDAQKLDFEECLLSGDLTAPQGTVSVETDWKSFPKMAEADFPALRREVETLLSGQFVPGTLPMIDNPRRGEILQKIGSLCGAGTTPSKAAPPLSEDVQVSELKKRLGGSPTDTLRFAFLGREHAGLWTVKVFGRGGNPIGQYYCPTANAVESPRMGRWLRRLSGTEQKEPWIETAPSGMMVLHGAGLPQWEKAAQKEILKIFADQLMEALEQERSAPAQAPGTRKEAGK